jgi:hypothetical protein
MADSDYRLYCMSCEGGGLCKVGYTSLEPTEKAQQLNSRYDKDFQFEWMRCTPGGEQRAHKIEGWWKHLINKDREPILGKEFYEADPEWLRDKLREASELSEYPISFSRHHA